MRIIIPSFEEIKLMPPTITLFHILAEMGHEVVYLTIFPDEYAPKFKESNITNIPLVKRNYTLRYNFHIPNIYGIRGIAFRADNLIKSLFAHKLKKWLRKNFKDDDLLWVVNEMTPILAGSSFAKRYRDKFIFTIYELHNSSFKTRNIKKVAQYAKVTVIPEYNRAHIQKYFFRLKKLPIILPNKPLNMYSVENMRIENDDIRNKLTELKAKGKTIILYMGIISPERPLETIIKAIQNNDNYELVILGRPSAYLDYLNQNYHNNFTYLGFVLPPEHINIASHADIGILIYVPQGNMGLNALYCAPNKIYEYTGLGLPILANDIPGLSHIINKFNCGVTADLADEENIATGLSKLIANSDVYKQGALDFYHSVDIKRIICKILNTAIEN